MICLLRTRYKPPLQEPIDMCLFSPTKPEKSLSCINCDPYFSAEKATTRIAYLESRTTLSTHGLDWRVWRLPSALMSLQHVVLMNTSLSLAGTSAIERMCRITDGHRVLISVFSVLAAPKKSVKCEHNWTVLLPSTNLKHLACLSP